MTQNVTISRHPNYGSLEIRFSARPTTEILSALKSAGWRWSPKSIAWWNRKGDESFAEQIKARSEGTSQATADPAEPASKTPRSSTPVIATANTTEVTTASLASLPPSDEIKSILRNLLSTM